MPPCPCGSDLDLAACCGRYHAGALAPTAEALMRSRYAAYALGRFDYLEATCAGPASADFSRAEAEALQLGTRWTGLEIGRVKKGGASDTAGTVAFVARFLRHGEPGALTETSEFRKIDGAWLYWDRAKLAADPANVLRAPGVGRNDPCPCGSGRKFKKCCG